MSYSYWPPLENQPRINLNNLLYTCSISKTGNVKQSFSTSDVNSDKQANIIATGNLNSVKTASLSKRQDKIKVFWALHSEIGPIRHKNRVDLQKKQ